ncbi:MAG: hypothetical protein WKF57_06665 [Nakamurella sp.]
MRTAGTGRKFAAAVARGDYAIPSSRLALYLSFEEDEAALFDLGALSHLRVGSGPIDTPWWTSVRTALSGPEDTYLLQNEQDSLVLWTDARWDGEWRGRKDRSVTLNKPATTLLRRIGGISGVEVHGNAVVTGGLPTPGGGFQLLPLPPRWVVSFRDMGAFPAELHDLNSDRTPDEQGQSGARSEPESLELPVEDDTAAPRLAKIDRLFARGIITRDEMMAQRRRVLDEI